MTENNNLVESSIIVEPEIDTEDEYALTEYDITASPNDFNIKTLFDFMQSGIVKIPAFQRNYVWDLTRASKLIESIIIGIPIPQIFLYEKSRNEFLVIDGQQRLMTIYYFMKRRFPKKDKRYEMRKIFDEHGKIPDNLLYDDDHFIDFNLKLPEKLPDVPNKLNKSLWEKHNQVANCPLDRTLDYLSKARQ